MEKDLAAAPEQHGELPKPVIIGEIVGTRNHPEGTNEFWGYWAEGYKAINKVRVVDADQLRTAIAAERERNPSVQANLARGLLWLAFVWNDHNFEAAHKEARRIAERAGIRSFEDANAWLEAAPAGAGAKGEGE